MADSAMMGAKGLKGKDHGLTFLLLGNKSHWWQEGPECPSEKTGCSGVTYAQV